MSMKDFKKGMATGAKPFEEKFEQHADAIKRVADKLENGMNQVTGVMNTMIDDMSAIEKKRLYDLNTQYDIKALEDYEKELLLAALFTLAKGEANEKQQAFIRSVKKYLDIKNPQTDVDLSGIENIENLNSQKAMFQTFAEYLFLGHEDDSFWDEYADLFDLFSVKKRDQDTIYNNIQQIYKTIGADGICEKYGFVPEKKRVTIAVPTEKSTSASLVIDKLLFIDKDEEKLFSSQQIKLFANIECAGKLHFEDCVIVYNSASITGCVIALDQSEITLSNCTVVDTNNEKLKLTEKTFSYSSFSSSPDKKASNWLFKSADGFDYANSNLLKKKLEKQFKKQLDAGEINEENLDQMKELLLEMMERFKDTDGSEDEFAELRSSILDEREENDADEIMVPIITDCIDNMAANRRLVCENSLLYNCKNLIRGFELHFSNNVIRYKNPPAGSDSVFIAKKNSGADITGCLIENTDEKALADLLYWGKLSDSDDSVGSYEREYSSPFLFENIDCFTGCTFKDIPRCAVAFTKADRCEFINCVDVLAGIKNDNQQEGEKNIMVTNCFFERCRNIMEFVTNVSNCQFSGCMETLITSFDYNSNGENPLHIEKCGFYNTKAAHQAILKFANEGDHTLEKCVFEGLDYQGRDAIDSTECLTIDGCSFKNCKIGYGEENDGTLIRISSTNFGGLFNKKIVGHSTYAKVKKCQNVKIKKYFGDDDDSDDEGAFLVGQKGTETNEIPIQRKTAQGENIGATVDADEVGVSDFDPLSV